MRKSFPSSTKEVQLSNAGKIRQRIAKNLGFIIAHAWFKQQQAASPSAPLSPASASEPQVRIAEASGMME